MGEGQLEQEGRDELARSRAGREMLVGEKPQFLSSALGMGTGSVAATTAAQGWVRPNTQEKVGLGKLELCHHWGLR